MKNDLFSQRRSGLLLHPTSLPGEYGIGTFGRWAYRWIDRLAEAGQTLWQLLPLGPTGFGHSPYQSYSAFAGNPLLIDLPTLEEEGLLSENLHGCREDFDPIRVEYEKVTAYKMPLLKDAYATFLRRGGERESDYRLFCEEEASWLEDYALFMALKRRYEEAPWYRWPEPLARREPSALEKARRDLERQIGLEKFLQFLFHRQWRKLKEYANGRGIFVIGDLPIYVSEDSSDTWAHRELFELDGEGRPIRVAGVPPDYFSETGQRWGNPLYDWDAMREEGYAWWLARLRKSLTLYDGVRIDHFRGFEAYWAIPACEETAVGGEWVEGPGEAFFEKVREALGSLPIIAEDLGIITEEVERLRDAFELPGMKVLQFAFDDGPDNPYLPHNYPARCVVYTGTHDNDTTVGWFEKMARKERVLSYLSRSDGEIHWAMIREASASVALFFVCPMQDLLGLGSFARMNRPGRMEGNWAWRLLSRELEEAPWKRLEELSRLYGRCVS